MVVGQGSIPDALDPMDLLGLDGPAAAPRMPHSTPPPSPEQPSKPRPQPTPRPELAGHRATAGAIAARPLPVQFVLPLQGKSAAAVVAAVQTALANDGRVLRRPAPECLAADGRVAVKCWLLPNLPAAERLHVEQRLRSAVA
jgi:hypothetical protein